MAQYSCALWSSSLQESGGLNRSFSTSEAHFVRWITYFLGGFGAEYNPMVAGWQPLLRIPNLFPLALKSMPNCLTSDARSASCCIIDQCSDEPPDVVFDTNVYGPSGGGSPTDLYDELWRACVGPLIEMPHIDE